MLFKGFRFGLLLQLAVGPVCMYLFQTAVNKGLPDALTGVAAVVLVDALYIMAAIVGIGVLLGRSPKVKQILQLFGGIIILIFGLNNILSEFGLSFLSFLKISVSNPVSNTFLYVLLLTLSNPLTILFWAGVFSAKIAEEEMKQQNIYLFGLGAVCSTAVFLVIVSLLGSAVSLIINDMFLKILNIGVGVVLMLFGIRTMCKKEENTQS